METAAVSYLNQHTRDVLNLVASGHTVEITDRGRPIARIIPIRPTLTGVAARLVAEGRARAPRSGGRLTPPDGPVDEDRRISRALAELRDAESC